MEEIGFDQEQNKRQESEQIALEEPKASKAEDEERELPRGGVKVWHSLCPDRKKKLEHYGDLRIRSDLVK